LVVNAVAETQPDGSVKVLGSPTEAMVINLLLAKGGNKTALESRYPRVAEVPFSSARKMSTAILRDPAGGYLVLTCGAFDVLPFADLAAQAPTAEARAQAQAQMRRRQEVHDGFAQQSLRMLALGSRHIQELPAADDLASVERDLVFEGLVGSMDPPRAGVAAAIATARNAGIRTVMITGDHAVTAAAIAEQIGLALPGDQVLTGVELAAMADAQLVENVAQYSVYARVSPEDKIRIVEAWQEHDQVVAMTGDGVNDAPALKAADVGVAMGITGTEVSKSAADIVLTDDNYSTIVKAVRQGREVFANIRKTIFFLLCVNFSEIVIMLGATIIGWGLPLTPIMLLLINVVGDGIPGLSLSREKSDDTIMLRNPIGRRESLFAGLQFVIAQQTIAFVLVGWAAFYLGAHVPLVAGLEPNLQLGQTMCFMVVGWTSILHVFNVRSRKSVFQSNIRANPRLAVSAVAMLVLFTLLAAVPVLRMIFGLYALGLYHWLLAIALSIIPLLIAEIGKLIRHGSESWRYRRRLVQHQGLSDY
ncbi:MAG: cation-translocating P-type ATPase, partial [Actinomycetia bacterium]|nr:cation-translocating P-type ATPase [Actinomycetes bacterium]